jgi:hypothetical protein
VGIEKANGMKYKIGDRVRITKARRAPGLHRFDLGEVVTIVKDYGDHYWAEGEDNDWGIDEDECESIKTNKS